MDVIDVEDILKALAHPARMKFLCWLKEPERHFASQEHPLSMGVCASQFEKCGLSQSTVSSHLAVLLAADLITARRVGQWIFYQRNEEKIQAFVKQLGSTL